MLNIDFNFDLIVCQLNGQNHENLSDDAWMITGSFDNIEIFLTPEQINVSEFPYSVGHRFQRSYKDLKNMLKYMPLIMSFKYNGEIKGYSETKWPQDSLFRVHSGMTYILHKHVMKVVNEKSFEVEITVRIERASTRLDQQLSGVQLHTHLNKLMKVSEFFPIMNEDEESTESTAHIESDEHSNTINHRFKARNIIIKRLAGLIKEAINNKPRTQVPVSIENCTFHPLRGGISSESAFDTLSEASVKEVPFSLPRILIKNCEKNINRKFPPVTKRCKFCQHNLTYLPKASHCPVCGNKTSRHSLKSEEFKTSDIVDDFAYQVTSNSEDAWDIAGAMDKRRKLRCTCNDEVLCNFCRLRNIYAVKQSITAKPDTIKDSHCNICTQGDPPLFTYCYTDEYACRPHLQRTFSALRTMYDLKLDTVESDTKCLKQLKKLDEISLLKKTNLFRKHFGKKQTSKISVNSKISSGKKRHKECLHITKSVPSHMGWLWTKDKQRNWKPGAIDKRIKPMIRYFLHKEAKKKIQKQDGQCRMSSINEPSTLHPPTLKVQKKGYITNVTLFPPPTQGLECDLKPCKPLKPITFQITKRPELILYHKLKKVLRGKFKKCTCNMPVSNCCCRTFLEKKHLEYKLRKECKKQQVPCCLDSFVYSDTSASELELDFEVTPPAGMRKPMVKKPQLISIETQYNAADYESPIIKFPRTTKFKHNYDAALGEKYYKIKGPAKGEDPCDYWITNKKLAEFLKKKIKEDAQNARELRRANRKEIIYEIKKKIPIVPEPQPPKPKKVNMMKYLKEKGVFKAVKVGKGKANLVLNPEYSVWEREQRRKKLDMLAEQTPPYFSQANNCFYNICDNYC